MLLRGAASRLCRDGPMLYARNQELKRPAQLGQILTCIRVCTHSLYRAGSFSRRFATEQNQTQPEIHEDRSLLGRYGLALYRACLANNSLDKVFSDLEQLKVLVADSPGFQFFTQSPEINVKEKKKFIDAMSQKVSLQINTTNFLTLLLENKRLHLLVKFVDAFEAYYRKHKGELKCTVISAKTLSPIHQKKILSALEKRCGANAKIFVEYETNPTILGGLIVKLGDQHLDYSMARRLDSLRTQLLSPL